MLYKTPPWTGEESSVVDDMLLEPRSGRTGYRGGRPSYGAVSVPVQIRTYGGCSPQVTFENVRSKSRQTNPKSVTPGTYSVTVIWGAGTAPVSCGTVSVSGSKPDPVKVALFCASKKCRVAQTSLAKFGSDEDRYGSPAMSVGPVSYQGGSWDTLGALALVLATGYGLYRRG